MPVPLQPPPGKRGSSTPRHPRCGIQAERFPGGFKASTAWAFICWACSLASEEVSLALLMNLTLPFPHLCQHRWHWEESRAFPSSRAQKSTGKSSICKKPHRAQPHHPPRGSLVCVPHSPAAAKDAATSPVPSAPGNVPVSGIPVRDGQEAAASQE